MAKGETYYVEHVEANIPWTTKETPDNVRTKGAIKFKDCLITIGEDNCARLSVLTKADEARLRNRDRGIVRIITKNLTMLKNVLTNHEIKFGPIKSIRGSCSGTFYITDISEEEAPLIIVNMPHDVRILMPNEPYYRWYDDNSTVVSDADLGLDDYENYDDEEEYA